jgi:hypothetical protein
LLVQEANPYAMFARIEGTGRYDKSPICGVSADTQTNYTISPMTIFKAQRKDIIPIRPSVESVQEFHQSSATTGGVSWPLKKTPLLTD